MILSILYQISFEVLFVDGTFILRTFPLDVVGSKALHKATLKAVETGYDLCYNKAYIEKTALAQKLIKALVEVSMDISEGDKTFDNVPQAILKATQNQ